MKRKVILLGIAAFALLLSSCSEDARDNSEETEKLISQITSEEGYGETDEGGRGILGDYTEAELSDTIIIMGEEYSADDFYGYLTVDADKCGGVTDDDLENIRIITDKAKENGFKTENIIEVFNTNGHDMGFLAEIPNIACIRFYNVGNNSLDFLSDFPLLESVELGDVECDPVRLAEVINGTNITHLHIGAENFSLSDFEYLREHLPQCITEYEGSDGNTRQAAEEPEIFALTLPIIAHYLDEAPAEYTYYSEQREAELRTLSENYKTVMSFIYNNSDSDITIDSVEVLRDGEQVYFTNGSSSLETDFTVPMGESMEFALEENVFDYAYAETGIYTVVYHYGDEFLTADFMIDRSENGKPDFLSDEQYEAFEKAAEYMGSNFSVSYHLSEEYASSHTPNEFAEQFYDAFTAEFTEELIAYYVDESGNLKAVDADRGSDITLCGYSLYPISVTDSEVIMLPIAAHYSEDKSYKPWYSVTGESIKLVLTDNGWRVDGFSPWW